MFAENSFFFFLPFLHSFLRNFQLIVTKSQRVRKDIPVRYKLWFCFNFGCCVTNVLIENQYF